MSRHWNAKREGWAGQWDRHRWPMPRGDRSRATRIGAGEIRLMLLGGVFLGLVVAAWGPSMPVGGAAPDLGARSDRVARDRADPAWVHVVDGDTFDYGGERIRIADIDTPEVRGDCAHERDLAARATARMRGLLLAGPFELHPLPDRDEDRYGRKLRVVTRAGRSLGDTLVAEGLARTWTGRREPWCA